MINKNYRIKKEKNFNLGLINKTANIHIKRTYTNIFITLTDLDNKVIICVTSGSADNTITNRRRKKIALAVEKIVSTLNYFFKLYEIKYTNIILKMKVRAHVYTLLSKLVYYGLIILSISSRKLLAHNGVKGRRLRRL
jgi:ribosomal protein S11